MGKNKTSIITLIYFLTLFLFCSCKENKPLKKTNSTPFKGYHITGKTTLKNANYAYIINEKGVKTDSSKVTNQLFSFKGTIKKPLLFSIQIDNTLQKHPIVLENKNYNLLLNNNQGMIIGGDLNSKLVDYKNIKSNFIHQKSDFYELLIDKDIDLRTYLNNLDSIRAIEKENFTNFIVNNQHNILSSIILQQENLSSQEASSLKKLLDTTNNTFFLNKLSALSESLKHEEAAKKILRRKAAPLFSGINLSGSKTYLAPLLKNKKMFIIDFWASWCPPCRESSPELIKLYNTYHHKGFDILTVSEDRSVADWKNGVYIDDIERWHHVYDDYNRISSLYNVTALPHIVLIDENGKIIKNKISIKDLKKQLQKTFD